MPTPAFQPPQGQQSTEQLQDWIVKLVRDINFLLSNLDTLNVNRLDAKVIIANTITANKMNVTQLSAITADLGTITAGLMQAVTIYGAYISTANGTYPRTEMSTTGNQFGAYQAADKFVKMDPSANASSPGFNFQNTAGHTGLLYMSPTDFAFLTPGGSANIQVSSGLDLLLSASNILKLSGTSLTMNSTPGVSGTVFVSTTSGGPATTAMTFTNGIRTA